MIGPERPGVQPGNCTELEVPTLSAPPTSIPIFSSDSVWATGENSNPLVLVRIKCFVSAEPDPVD